MSGIAGYVGLAGDGVDESVLRRMARQLEHRGPDGEGILVRGRVGLVHRRLAVIDRPGGEQPMSTPDGRFLLVYDGEVYNYRELRTELAELGHEFTTRSDTEVVLAAWAQWGSAALDRFNGMFALAILDTTTGELTLARDQFGIKPLYLAADGSGRVAFGSEIRPVLAAAVVPRRPDGVTIYRYLCFRVHDDTERTFFDRVTRLLPGQLAVITATGRIRRETYPTLRSELDRLASDPRPYDAAARAQVAAALQAAIRRRLVSDAPVGTVLSGGLNSSTVVATVNRLLAGRDAESSAAGPVQRTFSAVYPGERHDEDRYVDAVAAGCSHRLEVHKVCPNPDGFLADLVDFVRTQEEPVSSTGPYAQYCVMRRAGRHVTVMLDGQGADEMLAGHLPYHLVHLRQLRRERGVLAAGVELVRSAGVLWRLGRFRLAERLLGRRAVPAGSLLAPGFLAEHATERHEVVGDDLKRRLLDDMFRDSLPALLRYQDRNAMRFSVEGRVPFLDPPLLRLLWGLEPAAIIRAGWNQRALRDATAGLLPPLIRRRRNKIGFTAPEEAWSARLKNHGYEVFSSDSFGSRHYVDQAAVIAAFRAYLAGRNSAETMLFWRLLNLELWLREMIDRDPTRPPADTFVRHYPAPPKPDWQPNPDKQLITVDGQWARFPLRTELVRRGDDLPALAAARAGRFFAQLPAGPAPAAALARDAGWFLFVSEQAVAVAQGRSFAPADPISVCCRISAAIRTTLPAAVTARYRGAVVIDANDLGRSVLSHDTGLPPAVLAAAFADNPLGQARAQTPFAVTFQTADPELVISPVAGQGLDAGPGEPVDGGPGAGPQARPVRRIRLRSRARTS